jgi:hypothetical protein
MSLDLNITSLPCHLNLNERCHSNFEDEFARLHHKLTRTLTPKTLPGISSFQVEPVCAEARECGRFSEAQGRDGLLGLVRSCSCSDAGKVAGVVVDEISTSAAAVRR